jgi:hypothetical protein
MLFKNSKKAIENSKNITISLDCRALLNSHYCIPWFSVALLDKSNYFWSRCPHERIYPITTAIFLTPCPNQEQY